MIGVQFRMFNCFPYGCVREDHEKQATRNMSQKASALKKESGHKNEAASHKENKWEGRRHDGHATGIGHEKQTAGNIRNGSQDTKSDKRETSHEKQVRQIHAHI